ncbi:cytochrome oxidase complex assembly protein 1-domain-containing protein [Boeremia exigua]|uniref:cytochrome oxidase complex assembly protein 1-domain-containing protein n=1 Tax=Boeremia exigua TaxID=749465 RepID=UPI001E8C9E90|nr:cytochrome oxidase complex assembly protein 1-domain-containing protein [Boeremia exigua]KAH6639402.1 cytochrome oxidase complex assembly protein 1-domain-containing protein [Boeremia exigua]
MPPPRLPINLLRTRPLQLQWKHSRRAALAVRFASFETTQPSQPEQPTVPWKTPHSIEAWPPAYLIPPPKDGEVLLERKPNRALPPIPPLISPQVIKTFPIFVIAMTVSVLVFFNYQKQESSVVTSTLYALRTNPLVREELGDEIYFASKYPWISGEINQVHGRIDISFNVKGTRRQGNVRLRCKRRGRGGLYSTLEWSLTMEDGRKLELYDPKGDAIDPFQMPVDED